MTNLAKLDQNNKDLRINMMKTMDDDPVVQDERHTNEPKPLIKERPPSSLKVDPNAAKFK